MMPRLNWALTSLISAITFFPVLYLPIVVWEATHSPYDDDTVFVEGVLILAVVIPTTESLLLARDNKLPALALTWLLVAGLLFSFAVVARPSYW